MNQKKVFIQTFGCEMNIAESNSLEQSLLQKNIEICDDPNFADFIIVNTCSVRKSAESRASGQLSFYKYIRQKNKSKIILTGCMAEYEQKELKKTFPYVDYFINNKEKKYIPDLILDDLSFQKIEDLSFDFNDNYHIFGSKESYIPIQNGCNNYCSYCIVPYTRGNEISRPFDDIIKEVKKTDEDGSKIITLIGQNVNSYNYDKKTFTDLVSAIDSLDLKNTRRIYFESPHPKDFSDDLIAVLSSSKYFPHHYHIPVQSLSSAVLKAMNRKQTADEIFILFEKIRNKISDVTFSTDLMVGFPTETEEDFLQTMNALKTLSFTDAFMYYYNERPLTYAYKNYEDLSENIKKKRLEILIEEQRKISHELRKKKIGKRVEVYAKSKSKYSEKMLCYTASKEAVLVGNSNIKTGDFLIVTLHSLKGETFLGV